MTVERTKGEAQVRIKNKNEETMLGHQTREGKKQGFEILKNHSCGCRLEKGKKTKETTRKGWGINIEKESMKLNITAAAGGWKKGPSQSGQITRKHKEQKSLELEVKSARHQESMKRPEHTKQVELSGVKEKTQAASHSQGDC